MQSDFGICCTHMANGIFSHYTIPPKYPCTDKFKQCIILVRLRKNVFIQTHFCTIRVNAVGSTRTNAACAEQRSLISYVSIIKHEINRMCLKSCKPRMWCFLSETHFQTFSGIKIYDCQVLPYGYPAVDLCMPRLDCA